MQSEDYLYFSRRAREEDQAVREAKSIGIPQVHGDLSAAYRLRCQELVRADEPAPQSGRFQQSTASGLILLPPEKHRLRNSANRNELERVQ